VRLTVENVTVELDATTIITDAGMVIEAGEFVGLVGPNGSGKSTLLRTIYRALRPMMGVVCVGGDDVWSLSARASAQRTAVVVQESTPDFDLQVFDVVSMGRNPHKGPFDRNTAQDQRLCLDALERVEMDGLSDRDFATLSGGEKQRVFVARAIAQESRVLVLDEPTNHLDIRFQLELLDLVRGLGVTTIAAIHDLGLAAGHCDRIYVLEHGSVVGHGPPSDVLTAELVARVFGVRLRNWTDPETGRTHLSFDRLVTQDEPAARTAEIGASAPGHPARSGLGKNDPRDASAVGPARHPTTGGTPPLPQLHGGG
jgi:iron complex transport system ATP-binding protein